MKILITGASGFVGQYLLQDNTDTIHELIPITRNEVDEILNKKNISTNYYNIDAVIHLAGRAHVMRETEKDIYQAYATVNIDYTIKIAKLAKKLKINRFVFLSSVKVNGEQSNIPFSETDEPNPIDAYGKTKLEAEIALKKYCESNSIEHVIVRPPLIYGPGVKANFKQLIKLCSLPIPLPFASVANKRSFVSLKNLTNFLLLCCWHPKAANQTFLIADDYDVSTSLLIKIIRKAIHRPAMLFPVPTKLLYLGFWMIGKRDLSVRLLDNLQINIKKAKTLLDWQPVVSFESSILQLLLNEN